MKQRFQHIQVDALPGEFFHRPVVITVSKYKGKWRLDIRHHQRRNGKYVPSKYGINIPMTLHDKFIQAVTSATEESKGVIHE